MITKKKICKGCGEEQYIWARGMCKYCAAKNPKPKSLKEQPKKEASKPSGELALFQSIWASRPHKCAVCDEPLKEFNVWFFSHILSKGAFPKFRLYAKNIVLKCADHHIMWETKPNDYLVKKDIRWLPIIELHDNLVTEYYSTSQSFNRELEAKVDSDNKTNDGKEVF